MKKKLLRLLFYSLTVLIFYAVMTGGFFRGVFQPILLIPLAVAVSMREREFFSFVFAFFCAFALDLAQENLIGMSALWLCPLCYTISTAVSVYLRQNSVNFFWINAVVSGVSMLLSYFFTYVLPAVDGGGIILLKFLMPAYISGTIISPIAYGIVLLINSAVNGKPKKEKINLE